MIDVGVGATVITPGANMRYLTGYSEEAHERLLCLVVSVDAEPTMLVPAINLQEAQTNPAGIADVRSWSDSDSWYPAFESLISSLQLLDESIAVDDDMPARFLVPLGEIALLTAVSLAGSLVAPMRSIKDAAEIAAIRAASEVTEQALVAGRAACRPGASEREVAAAIDDAFRSAGAVPSFETIVAAGPNSAKPHHMPSEHIIAAGEVVLFDLGAMLDDYRGDITRVYRVGNVGEQAHQVYDIAYRAQRAAEAAALPGATGSQVDQAAREIISAAGYGEQFIHRTGHGLGLDAHEEPNMSESNNRVIEPGNVFSIEPGIYLAGQFGVRLENIVAVTSDGIESMNGAIPSGLMDVSDFE